MPTETLKARGSRLAGLRAGEVQYEKGTPNCPGFLSPEGKTEWRRVVKQLELAGVLQLTDRALLAAYCEAWADFVETRKAIDALPEEGRVEVSIANKLSQAKDRAVDRLLRLAQQFGFSPSARTRVKGDETAQPSEPEGKGRFFAG